jgi:hypothetical protein
MNARALRYLPIWKEIVSIIFLTFSAWQGLNAFFILYSKKGAPRRRNIRKTITITRLDRVVRKEPERSIRKLRKVAPEPIDGQKSGGRSKFTVTNLPISTSLP